MDDVVIVAAGRTAVGKFGGSLAKMPGLIREARDMQGIRKEASARKDAGGGGGEGGGPSEPPSDRGPRKKG